MLSSVLATFDASKSQHVKTVLNELKQDENLNIRGIVYGRLFEKITASIVVPEVELQHVFEKLLANDIHIYRFDEAYSHKIDETVSKMRTGNSHVKDRIRTYHNNQCTFYRSSTPRNDPSNDGMIPQERIMLPTKDVRIKKKEEVKPNFEFLNKGDSKTTNYSLIDKLCKEGDYLTIDKIVKKNPVMNRYAKDKYVPAIKNCIKINLDKALENWSFVDSAFVRLKDIVCNKEIMAITSDDLIGAAGNALISICAKHDPEKLILISNLANIGPKTKTMAFIKLSEIIFEDDKNKLESLQLLKRVTEQINTRSVLLAYDVMEAGISDLNKNRFNALLDTIIETKNGIN